MAADHIVVECVDCGQAQQLTSVEAILRHRAVCGFCYIQRGITDYQDWCGAENQAYDTESAEEYLNVTTYGAHMPEWIQVRVMEWAANAA